MSETTRPPVTFVSTVDGVRIACAEIGDGPPLVFVRGVNSHLDMWWDDPAIRNYFRALARAHRVVRFDARGNGLSDREIDEIELEGLVEDVRAVVDGLGLGEITLYGQGFGGPVAIAYAAAHPDRVTNLVLHGAYARGSDLRALESFADLFRTMPDAAFTWLVHQSYPDSDTIPARKVRMNPRSLSAATAAAYFSLAARLDVTPLLSEIRARTLVLHPERGAGIPVRCSRELAAEIPGARFVLMPGSAYNPWGEEPGASLRAVADFLGTGAGDDLDTDFANPGRALATVLFTDIVGSTEKMAGMGDQRWGRLLQRHDAAVEDILERFDGRYVEDTGDGMLATFSTPAAAIRCAAAIRDALHDLDLEIRAGIHTGEAEWTGSRIRGLAVHLAARIVQAADPGQILVSRTVTDLTAGSGFTFTERGEHDLRGVPGRWALFAVDI